MEGRRSLSLRLTSLGLYLLASSGSGSGSSSATAAVAGRQAGTTAAGHAAAYAHPDSLASDLNECSTQASICLDDVECLECMTSYVDHPLEYAACLSDYEPDWPSATVCDAKAAKACCFDLVSRGSCLESGYFLEYWECWFDQFAGCPDYELTCMGNGNTAGSSSSSSSPLSSSARGNGVVEEAASQENGVAGRAPSRARAVAVASGLAGIVVATGALLVL